MVFDADIFNFSSSAQEADTASFIPLHNGNILKLKLINS